MRANSACLDGVITIWQQETRVSLQGKRETFQGHKTLKMHGLDRLLDSPLLFFFFNDLRIACTSILLGYKKSKV